MSIITIKYLGRQDFHQTWGYQRSLLAKRLQGKIPDTLLLVEHDHVYTIGRTGSESNILFDRNSGAGFEIPVVHIDRGGDITYHGPGQLVGYPILNLTDHYLDLHKYLRDIEDVIILTLADYDIHGEREYNKTGVWVNGSKIAAIGVKVSRWITMHGFALNVSTDLRYFDSIHPCGMAACRVTSMKELLKTEIPLESVAGTVVKHFTEVFDGYANTIKSSINAVL